MTNVVIALPGARLPPCAPPAPNAELVECLSRLLAQAEAGELQAIVYAAVPADGTVRTGWSVPDPLRWQAGSAVGMLMTRFSLAQLEGQA
jgi:hypothetical protein